MPDQSPTRVNGYTVNSTSVVFKNMIRHANSNIKLEGLIGCRVVRHENTLTLYYDDATGKPDETKTVELTFMPLTIKQVLDEIGYLDNLFYTNQVDVIRRHLDVHFTTFYDPTIHQLTVKRKVSEPVLTEFTFDSNDGGLHFFLTEDEAMIQFRVDPTATVPASNTSTATLAAVNQ